jgi:hypothetical protein
MNPTDRKTTTRSELDAAAPDWAGMTRGEQIRFLEVEGYVVLPGLLDAERIFRIKSQVSGFATDHVDYSVNQRGRSNVQFAGGDVSDLIAFPPMVEFLRMVCGEIVLMSCDFGRSEPGHPGISLHCDGQPWGSNIFGAEYTCPRLLRVLYYLDELSPETSPFRVIPRSHLSYHNQANPYLRYEEHPEELMVTCPAGSAVVFSHNAFHGNYPNTGNHARESIQLSYRPTWAGPAEPVEPWDTQEVARLPAAVQALMGNRSGRVWVPEAGNKPAEMPREAEGLNPSRWGL